MKDVQPQEKPPALKREPPSLNQGWIRAVFLLVAGSVSVFRMLIRIQELEKIS
jgi:hypothetical protein